MDYQVLKEFSQYIEWEKDIKWMLVQDKCLETCEIKLDELWLRALSGKVPIKDRVKRLWSGMANLMPRSYAVFSEKVLGIALLETRKFGVSLVYFFETGGELVARRGYAPVRKLPIVSANFPVDLSPFYKIHNGLVNFMSYDGGLLPSWEWQTLYDSETKEPSLIKIAVDGSEVLGFDISSMPTRLYFIQPDDQSIEPVSNFWFFIDDLIAGCIEDL